MKETRSLKLSAFIRFECLKEIEMTDFEKREDDFLTKLHAAYLERVKFYHLPNTELTRFSWTENKKIILYAIKVYTDHPYYDYSTMYFAIKNNSQIDNKLVTLDMINNTKTPKFSRIMDADVLKRTAWLINEKLIDKKINSLIIKSSVKFSFIPFEKNRDEKNLYVTWAQRWVDKEYDETQKAESMSTLVQSFPNFPDTKQRFFIDRYHFKDMLDTIDDSQFTDEFNQCLFAYELEKWFLCATGLGSCLEHLMLIILTNYDNNGYRDAKGDRIFKGFPKNPTAQDYVRYFKKEPINITSRQATFINLLFTARNSVDHHNTGKTQKNLCDLLLDGISDMYNDYYSNSILLNPKKS